MSASLVHSHWRAQAQAELVSYARYDIYHAYCDGIASLLGLANFLEKSKQVRRLCSLSIDLNQKEFREEIDLPATDVAGMSVGCESSTSALHPTPFWLAAKRMVDLGVRLDTLCI